MDLTNYNVGVDNTIVTAGDSLFAGAGGKAVASILGELMNCYVHNESIGGQIAEQIFARMSGVFLTISGNVTNGSNPVSVTNLSVNLLSTAADTTTRQISGTINGIQYLLERSVVSGTETYTLTPALSAITTISPNSKFVCDNSHNYKKSLNILWWGRNNVPSLSDVPSIIQKYIDTLYTPQRFFVVGILPAYTEINGNSNRVQIDNCNFGLQNTYQDRYISSNPPTQLECDFWGYTLNTTDLTEIATGVFPTTMRADSVHLNILGYSIIAKRLFDKICQLYR